MGDFNSQTKESTPPVMEELDRKIATMNQYLVDGRAELDRLEKQKTEKEEQIVKLNESIKELADSENLFRGEVDNLNKVKTELDEQITQCKNELLLEQTKFDDAVKQREAEEAKSEEIKADCARRLKEVDEKESASRVFAKGLEEKEKKLDEMAAKMGRFVNGLKEIK